MAEKRDRRWLLALSASRPFVALWGGLLVVDAVRVLPDRLLPALGAMALLVAVCSWHQGPAVAGGVALTGWALVTGFVVNAGGLLTVSGFDDVARALLLLGCAAAGSLLGSLVGGPARSWRWQEVTHA
jgi:hypothetical protein